MPATDVVVLPEAVQHVVGQIRRRFSPQRIILFGSYATGAPTADSDVDLVVLLDTEQYTLRMAARIAAAVDHPWPLDILVYTPGAWREALGRGSVFVTDVHCHGVIAYCKLKRSIVASRLRNPKSEI